MSDEHGAWQTFGERPVYDNRWVRVALADVQAPNGQRWEYHVVDLQRVAIGMVLDVRERVLMLWRYRFPTDQWGYELLGGLVEDGEEPAACAAREVEEESGWRPIGAPEHLVGFQPLPGQVRAHTDVFLWREAEQVGPPTDTEEVGRLEWVPLSRIPALVDEQKILGAGAIIPLLRYIARAGIAREG